MQALLEQVGRRVLLEPGIQVILVIPGTTARLALVVPQETQAILARLAILEPLATAGLQETEELLEVEVMEEVEHPAS